MEISQLANYVHALCIVYCNELHVLWAVRSCALININNHQSQLFWPAAPKKLGIAPRPSIVEADLEQNGGLAMRD